MVDINREQSTTAVGTSTTPAASWGSSPTANNLLIAALNHNGSDDPGTPSGWSVGWTVSNGTSSRTDFYYKVAAGGDANLSFTITSTAWTLVIAEYSDMDGTPADQNNFNAATTTQSNTTSITPASQDVLIIAVHGARGAFTQNAQTGYTILADLAEGNSELDVGEKAIAGGSSENSTCNISGSRPYASGIMSFLKAVPPEALAATMVGVGAMTAALGIELPLALTMAGSGAMTADLTPEAKLVVTMAGVGAMTADLTPEATLAVTMAGVGQMTVGLQVTDFQAFRRRIQQ